MPHNIVNMGNGGGNKNGDNKDNIKESKDNR